MLDVNTTIEVAKWETLGFDDCDIKLTSDWNPSLRFGIEEHLLAHALNAAEAQSLVDELAAKHGVSIFENVAQSVIDEYGVTEE